MATSCTSDTTREPNAVSGVTGEGSGVDPTGPVWGWAVAVAAVLCAACSPDCRRSAPQVRGDRTEESNRVRGDSDADRRRGKSRGDESARGDARRRGGEETTAGREGADSAGGAGEPGLDERARILALGDSYTAGVGVERGERWPDVLVERLRSDGHRVADPRLVATGGWTTAQLLSALEAGSFDGPFDAVVVLIGTNDALSDVPPDRFRREFRTVLERAAKLAAGEAERVVALTLPDYSVTPVGERIGAPRADRDVETFNSIIREEADREGARAVDLAPVSDRIAEDPDLLVDALHPGPAIQAAWVDRMYTAVESLVERRDRPGE